MKYPLLSLIFLSQQVFASELYRAPSGFVNSGLSETKPNRSEELRTRSPSQVGKGDEENRFGKVVASPNSQNLTERGIVKPNPLKGVNAITIYSQIYPHSLDRAFESALIKTLSKTGKVIEVNSIEASPENFYSAVSNSTLLKLSLHNWVVEIENDKKKQFKVEMQIVLECSNKVGGDSEETNIVWVGEEDFDFFPNETKLKEAGQQAVEKLVKQFIREYQQQNTDGKRILTFYVL